MKIGFVHQPLGGLRVPLEGDSIGIWTHAVARHCADWAEISVYARSTEPWRSGSPDPKIHR